MNESVLDTPKQKLDETMWVLNNGSYTPTPEATEKINSVIEWVMIKTGINSFKVHITGSITSNQYSDDSDIDLHFISETFTDEMVEDLNKNIRELFQTEYKTVNDVNIGTHEIEIYFQINEFQDMMSIGCYDFINKEWIVGPEFLSTNFDPYSEYYNDDMKYINSIIDDIRNVILEVYELLIVINNSNDEEFKSYEFNQLIDKLAKAANIFTSAREFRKVYSTPTSKEDALSKRSSRKWKIADSAFKLLDKFGYLAILRDMTSSWESIQDNNSNKYNIINTLIQSFDKNLNMNPNINENDRTIFSAHLDESLSKNMSVIALIASILAIPQILPAKTLEKNLKNVPVTELNIGKPATQKAILKSSSLINGVAVSNIVNAVTRTIFRECRGESYKGFENVASVIWNRAGGKPEKFMSIVSAKLQFSCWNSYTGKWDNDFKFNIPYDEFNNKQDRKEWGWAQDLAIQMVKKQFVPVSDYNCYLNKDKASKKALTEWGHLCTDKIDRHHFGYQKCYDGFLKNAKFITYKVKKGDNLTKISKTYNVSIKRIMSVNKTIKNANSLKIGQVIKIPKN